MINVCLSNYNSYFYEHNMKKSTYNNSEEQIARYMKAMSHPARVAIINFLISQESCFFGDIHEILPIAKATVSQHLTELKNAGLIQGEIIPPKVKYCINRDNWELAQKLIGAFMNSINPSKKECCK